MNQSFYGSIDITKLLYELKAKHSGFYKGNNGKVYANVEVWVNENQDKFGNVMSIKIKPSKANKDIEKAFYLGNCKKSEGPKPISDNDTNGLDVDLDVVDPLPSHPKSDIQTQTDDLPF